MPPVDEFPIDPLFRELYNYLGGENTLGPGISVLMDNGSLNYQYTINGMMVYDPAAPATQRFRLAPLGVEMGISEAPAQQAFPSDERMVDGHIIFTEFVSFYDKLGGARFVGRPLTEVHYNLELRRYEQYFENLGFYRLADDAPENVRLLAYGLWKCDHSCRGEAPRNSMIVLYPDAEYPFADFVSQVGTGLTGFAISEAYTDPDGKREQIFEYAVLVADPDNPGKVYLRSLQEKLGLLPEPLAFPSGEAGMYFYPIDGEKGYNVPEVFLDFLAKHGGLGVAGPPISQLALRNNGDYRQCFANLCLEMDSSGRVRPTSIGYTYKQLFYQPARVLPPTPLSREISLEVWEVNPMIDSRQVQGIGSILFENGLPMANVEPVLTITMPDGNTYSTAMPPTGADGRTMIQLMPISAANGTLIPYQVCINSMTGEKFCVKDSYLIWNTQ